MADWQMAGRDEWADHLKSIGRDDIDDNTTSQLIKQGVGPTQSLVSANIGSYDLEALALSMCRWAKHGFVVTKIHRHKRKRFWGLWHRWYWMFTLRKLGPTGHIDFKVGPITKRPALPPTPGVGTMRSD